MVIKDHEAASGLAEMFGLGTGIGPAVNRNNQGGECLFEAAFHPCGTQPIPLSGTVRDEAFDDSSGSPQIAAEDREGGDPVDVVITVKGDPFLGGYRRDQALGCSGYSGDFLRRPEGSKLRVEKQRGLLGCRETPRKQQVGDDS